MRYCSSDFKVLGLEKSKCASCSSDFKVLGLEKSKCAFFFIFYVPFLRFFTDHMRRVLA